MARVAAGDIVTTRDDHRSVRLQVGAAEGGLNGKIEYLDARECQQREGESYPDEASAKRRCRAIR